MFIFFDKSLFSINEQINYNDALINYHMDIHNNKVKITRKY